MVESTSRLAWAAVTTGTLAIVLGVSGPPSLPAAPPPDFGPAAASPDTAAARLPAGTGPRAGAGHQDPPPRRVLVPGVGLDARVTPVGVSGQGDLAVPEDPAVAGWYRFGPEPGSARGSAVLVGHVDGDTGALGEFAALFDVRRGDRVEVRRAGAGPAVYRVVSRVTVPKEDLPVSVFRRTGAPVLTLITCAPPFAPGQGGYLANLVVTAEPAGT
ncbi:class F sortase [Streptomyces sp. NPDC085946]|uniref:class F sortase n=1 Tax=Streptomyces sp. NPDC085946 TaxID=3365744 RepID=UPI0037D3C4CC